MKCLYCDFETDEMRDNSGLAATHLKEFGIGIPRLEIWCCKRCDTAWKYLDGKLNKVGFVWDPVLGNEIPDGLMAVIREQPL